MQADKTTLNDLSIFHSQEEQSVFHHLDFTTTIGGREWLKHLLANPLSSISQITETQQLLQLIIEKESEWPATITNGTVMVVQKFYETGIEDIPANPNVVNSLSYRLIYAPDFSLLRYSVTHFIDFAKGLQQFVRAFYKEDNPPLLQNILNRIAQLLNTTEVKQMFYTDKAKQLSNIEVLTNGRFLRSHYKAKAIELIEIFSRLDAYYSMAIVCKKYQYSFPKLYVTPTPYINARGLYHPLLPQPVAYDVVLNQDQNFLFLTGANMAGKSTFIKAIGVSVYLAHVGMGVPAQTCSLSLFDGLLSNIQVEDNIFKGESYFFNEVQRIKKTIVKINDGRNWLILIDELFKGTNVQDAMRCSTSVIEGLRKMTNALFILSTHLYEIGNDLMQYPNIKFYYFETHISDGQLVFSYQLKEGISNDRLGYLILKREGVVDMLEKL